MSPASCTHVKGAHTLSDGGSTRTAEAAREGESNVKGIQYFNSVLGSHKGQNTAVVSVRATPTHITGWVQCFESAHSSTTCNMHPYSSPTDGTYREHLRLGGCTASQRVQSDLPIQATHPVDSVRSESGSLKLKSIHETVKYALLLGQSMMIQCIPLARRMLSRPVSRLIACTLDLEHPLGCPERRQSTTFNAPSSEEHPNQNSRGGIYYGTYVVCITRRAYLPGNHGGGYKRTLQSTAQPTDNLRACERRV
eukprot:3368528-Pyramimonas_sp.AAC.3